MNTQRGFVTDRHDQAPLCVLLTGTASVAVNPHCSANRRAAATLNCSAMFRNVAELGRTGDEFADVPTSRNKIKTVTSNMSQPHVCASQRNADATSPAPHNRRGGDACRGQRLFCGDATPAPASRPGHSLSAPVVAQRPGKAAQPILPKRQQPLARRHSLPSAPLACPDCDDGRHWTSRYGGNDPDVWTDGPCHTCHGTLELPCCYCDQRNPQSAVIVCTDRDHQFPLCEHHHTQWLIDMEDE